MQWMAGNVEMVADVKGIGDLFGKAIAWSNTLEFKVEKSGKSLIGSAVSAVSDEGLVNVYRGTGKVLMAPTL